MSSNSAVTALMSRIESIFGEPDSPPGTRKSTFLTFCFPGVAISPHDLGFNRKTNQFNLTTEQASQAAAQFACLVNRIPQVSHCWPSDGDLLWNEYQTLLKDAVLASIETNPQDKKTYDRISNALYPKQEIADLLGKRTAIVDSKKLAEYKAYQIKYQQANTRYQSLKQAAQFSDDPMAVQQWSLQRDFYKAEVDNARNDWITRGHKNEIETALAMLDQIEKRNPKLAWSQWQEELELSKLTTPENQDFYLTQFSPALFYESGGNTLWQRLTWKPAEDDSVMDSQETELSIKFLSVELIKVQILRPWMNSNIFEAQFWQWPDERKPLSNGADSPQGTLPAYATSMIVARNLTIELESDSEQNTAVLEKIKLGNKSGQLVSWGPFSLTNATVSGSNSIQCHGMQVVAMGCQKLPKSPNPDLTLPWPEISPPDPDKPPTTISVKWLGGEYQFNPKTKISQVKVVVQSAKEFPMGSTNVDIRVGNVEFKIHSPIELRINHGQWWVLENTQPDHSNTADQAIYGAFEVDNLTVEDLSDVSVELQPDRIVPLWAAQVKSLRLEVNVEGHGWIAYKQWQPGWLETTQDINSCQLQ
jgi:hypothetical protein